MKRVFIRNISTDMSSDFNIFWELYGKKRERGDAERAWGRLTDDERQAAVKGIAAYHKQCQKEGKAPSYPAAYLNQKQLWQKTKGRPPKAAKRISSAPKDPETW